MSKHLARMGRKNSLLKEGNHQQNQPLGVTVICHDWLGMRNMYANSWSLSSLSWTLFEPSLEEHECKKVLCVIHKMLLVLAFLLMLIMLMLEYFSARFSTDEGQCWNEYNFTKDPIFFTGLASEPGARSMNVSIWGYRDSYLSQYWTSFTIDFKELLTRTCEWWDLNILSVGFYFKLNMV